MTKWKRLSTAGVRDELHREPILRDLPISKHILLTGHSLSVTLDEDDIHSRIRAH